MHVTHVTACLSRTGGGIAEAVWALAAHERAEGLAAVIYGLRDPHRAADVSAAARCPARVFPVTFPRQLYHSPQLTAALATPTAGHDLIHQHGFWLHPAYAAGALARRRDLPRIVSLHGGLLPRALRRSAWKKALAWRLFARANLQTAECLHATSVAEAAGARRLGLRQPIAIVPLGVDAAAFADIRPEPDARTVAYLGRLHPDKGVADLLEAWATLAGGYPDWRIEIAGPDEGGCRAALEHRVAKLGIGGSVRFLGPVYGADKKAFLARAALLVLPSHGENFGHVVAEALASGLPVITTRATPWRDLETHGCGWWIDTGPQALAAALDTALQIAPAERASMGSRGRAVVADRYTWARVAAAFAAVARWLTTNGPRPTCVHLGAVPADS